jgi:hypothetical protein
MVEHAKCLWTAVALPVPGAAPLAMRAEAPAVGSVSCRDDESPETAPLYGGSSISRRCPRQRRPGCREAIPTAPNPLSHDLHASMVLATSSPPENETCLTTGGTHTEPIERHLHEAHGRHQFRSLSYLSLTLCCAALHSGWLEGCVAPSSRRDARIEDKGTNSGKDEGRQKHRRGTLESWPRPSSISMNWTDSIFP